MNKKEVAKETLIFFGSVLLILAICGVWYLSTNNESTLSDIKINQIGFRENLFNNLNAIKEKNEFEKIIEIKDKPIFIKTIADTAINKTLYNKSKEFEKYI